MSLYSKSSPYYKTSDDAGYLDVMVFRDIIGESDDIYYTIEKKYEYRPDLLAFCP